jgi:hypothetical protein
MTSSFAYPAGAATVTPRCRGHHHASIAASRIVLADFEHPTAVTNKSDVAEAVWRAANDASGQLRFPAGPDAVALAQST